MSEAKAPKKRKARAVKYSPETECVIYVKVNVEQRDWARARAKQIGITMHQFFYQLLQDERRRYEEAHRPPPVNTM